MTMNVVLAVDLGGTKVEAGLVEPGGVLRAESRRRAGTGRHRTPQQLGEAVSRVVQATMRTLQIGDVLIGAGIGSAGPVDRDRGTISPLNLDVTEFPISRLVEDALPASVPVRLGLDGQCIAIAEATIGAARRAPSSLSMVVSTGVGGGIVLGGQILHGDNGNAGHVGQLRVSGYASVGDPRVGTLEELASGPASVAWANTQGWIGTTGENLAADARAGNAVARSAIVRSATSVGSALAGVAALLDIKHFVVGGGFSYAAADYTEIVQSTLRNQAVLPAARQALVLRPSLGSDAPLVGAACLVGWESVSPVVV